MYRLLTALKRGFKEKIGWKRLGLALSLLIIALAITHLVRTLKGVDGAVIVVALTEIAPHRIALAALCVVGAFCTLTFYDFFALRTIGKNHVPYRIAALSSFTSYTIGHNIGATVFTGKDNRCSRDRYGFSNCCGGSSVTQCSDAEKKTVELREAGKCASAGDYCSRKNIFGCYETTESYCCFGSLLARIVQEQGRSQLGRSFGDPKSPDCSGLTIAELTAIDWSKIDFTEFYATITPEDPKASEAKAAAGAKQQSCYWGSGRC